MLPLRLMMHFTVHDVTESRLRLKSSRLDQRSGNCMGLLPGLTVEPNPPIPCLIVHSTDLDPVTPAYNTRGSVNCTLWLAVAGLPWAEPGRFRQYPKSVILLATVKLRLPKDSWNLFTGFHEVPRPHARLQGIYSDYLRQRRRLLPVRCFSVRSFVTTRTTYTGAIAVLEFMNVFVDSRTVFYFYFYDLLHNLFWASLLSNSTHDECMISVFSPLYIAIDSVHAKFYEYLHGCQ